MAWVDNAASFDWTIDFFDDRLTDDRYYVQHVGSTKIQSSGAGTMARPWSVTETISDTDRTKKGALTAPRATPKAMLGASSSVLGSRTDLGDGKHGWTVDAIAIAGALMAQQLDRRSSTHCLGDRAARAV